MKKLVFLIFFSNIVFAQEAVHNFGNMQLHGTAMMGFHMDVINNGAFYENKGLVGFYSMDRPLTFSGGSNPVFHDMEVAADKGLYVDNTIGIENDLNLISGDIITSRNSSAVNINFLNDSFYNGEGHNTKVDGYAAVSNKTVFTFPVGQGDRLRPLGITSQERNEYAKCAYFYEDPNTPSTFATSFNTDVAASDVLSISNFEFWHLQGEVPTQVTLTWDEKSYVTLLAEYITDLKVVGWSIREKRWINLGNNGTAGDLENGSVTSEIFTPSEYQVITLGGSSNLETLENISLGNYYMTPNGDGTNDYLVIEGLEKSPNNTLQIFNRYGIMVYSKKNYSNEFNGISNVNAAITKDHGLAAGVYFYIVTLDDLNQRHQGYLYLSTYQKN